MPRGPEGAHATQKYNELLVKKQYASLQVVSGDTLRYEKLSN